MMESDREKAPPNGRSATRKTKGRFQEERKESAFETHGRTTTDHPPDLKEAEPGGYPYKGLACYCRA